MKKAVIDKINEQINKEYYSAYLYLKMSVVMEEEKKPGYANWLFHQYKEELEHAEDFVRFLQKRGVAPVLETIEATDVNERKPLEIARRVLAHEVAVSESIYELWKIAADKEDYPAVRFAQKYVDEQVEEEEHAQAILDMYELAGDNLSAQLFVDGQLGARK